MAGLGQFGAWRHIVVGASIGAVALAVGTGLVGRDNGAHFDSKQVVVSPAGDTALHLHEVVDMDLGHMSQHGYQRIVPNDFGVPTKVVATATDAPDDVSVTEYTSTTQIRVGDPNVTVTGQHRYTLDYVLPAVDFSVPGSTDPAARQLALDIIGTDETLRTDTFEVVVTGFELADPLCNVGGAGASGGCELVDDGDVYRAVIAPLKPGEGITIGGTIVGSRPVVDVAPPPLPGAAPDRRAPLTAGATALGLAAGVGTYAWARRKGSNEVTPGGAADAAYGLPPPPGDWLTVPAAHHDATELPPPTGGRTAVAPPPFRLVPDSEMSALATTEFVPPKGIDPWVGYVLLNEQVDNHSIQAWVSGYAARDVITVERGDDDEVTMAQGPKWADADADDRALLADMLGDEGRIVLGTYSKPFASAWTTVRSRQTAAIDAAGYWKRPLRSTANIGLGAWAAIGIVGALWLLVAIGRSAIRGTSLFSSPWFALGLGLFLPLVIALVVYSRMLPALTATGSALALRTESFRRFLQASEGRHVEWAWKQGLLREYSAWAVALGAAQAWERALKGSSVPPTETTHGPLLVYYAASSFSHTTTAPSSSGGHGGGFGGGFSGGSVGGGGGGGSSGSW